MLLKVICRVVLPVGKGDYEELSIHFLGWKWKDALGKRP